jgi:hypothetical protein
LSFQLTKPPQRRRFVPTPGIFTTGTAYFLSGCGLVLVIGGMLMWLNHLFPDRENDSLRSYPSPDKKLQAVSFRRTVQGKDTHTTHVTIIGTSEKLPNRSGKAFIAEGVAPLEVHWIDNSHLLIKEPEGTKVILRAAQVGPVKITDR